MNLKSIVKLCRKKGFAIMRRLTIPEKLAINSFLRPCLSISDDATAVPVKFNNISANRKKRRPQHEKTKRKWSVAKLAPISCMSSDPSTSRGMVLTGYHYILTDYISSWLSQGTEKKGNIKR